MTGETLLGVVLFGLAASMTPGPNNVMLMASGVNFGFVRTLPHLVGVVLGFALMLFGVGLGLGALIHAVPTLALVLKVAAGLYMVYLAWAIAFAGAVGADERMRRPLTVWQAVAFQWVNPKGVSAGLALTAAYGSEQQPLVSAGIIAGVVAAITCLSASSWTLFGLGLRRFLADPRRLRVFNGVMGLLLLATIVPMLR